MDKSKAKQSMNLNDVKKQERLNNNILKYTIQDKNQQLEVNQYDDYVQKFNNQLLSIGFHIQHQYT